MSVAISGAQASVLRRLRTLRAHRVPRAKFHGAGFKAADVGACIEAGLVDTEPTPTGGVTLALTKAGWDALGTVAIQKRSGRGQYRRYEDGKGGHLALVAGLPFDAAGLLMEGVEDGESALRGRN